MKSSPKPQVPTQGARFADLIARMFDTERQNKEPEKSNEEEVKTGDKKST